MKTYNDVYLKARKELRSAGVAAHDLEARLIVSNATGKTREELVSASNVFLTNVEILKKVDNMVDRRKTGEPVAYIVGEWEFYSIPLIVNTSVLIPRTDTEVLAGAAINILRQNDDPKRVLDLCTGCGCIGLAIAANVPNCRVVLADKSENALAVCRANMLKTNLSKMTMAVAVDALALPPAMMGTFDMIVCNPPYIPTSQIDSLDNSVRDYEPAIALDGGDDGLKFFRAITASWASVLRSGGHLAYECGIGQAEILSGILKENGFGSIETYTDSLDIERVVIGQWETEQSAERAEHSEERKVQSV